MTGLRYSVVEVDPGAARPFAVMRSGKIVELHSTAEAAGRKRDRLNGLCVSCRRVLPDHAADCPLAGHERDLAFGSGEDLTG